MNLSLCFVLFMIYSFIGWIMEVIFTLHKDKTLVNRGFLMGPYCPIYGCGCILIILLLNRYLKDPVALFIMSMVICSILEYVTSFIMEKLFKARWWDYSDRKFNINGRICLETLIPFGLLGCLLIYVINPIISRLILKIPSNVLNVIAVILMIIFILDNIVSYSIITKIHVSTKGIVMDNTEEITKKVKEYISKNSKFGKRLMKSFPHLKVLKEKYKIKNKESKK
ncbi:MAG: putative ABC transporter permease [Candidatus Aphodocola sp.]